MNSDGLAWYEELRKEYRPQTLRVLLIGESPPDPGDRARRFFYAPTLAKEDNLYRGVAKALYDHELDVRDKPAVLARLRDHGFWLIDAVDEPINKKTRAERRRLIRARLADLVARAVELAPTGGTISATARLRGHGRTVATRWRAHPEQRVTAVPDRQLARQVRDEDARCARRCRRR
jgi:hypothetical protein